MSKHTLKSIQVRLATAGFYHGALDGIWGPVSDGALDQALAAAGAAAPAPKLPEAGAAGLDLPMAWGAHVSRTFRDRIRWICKELAMNPNDLMSCIAFESGRTFSPSVRNAAGSGATGLIQFMPSTALTFYYSREEIEKMTPETRKKTGKVCTDRLAAMTAEDQLNYVYRYFLPYKGRLKNVGDVYMAILWPAGVGKPDTHTLWEAGKMPTTYAQNRGLDLNGDKRITRGEAVHKIKATYDTGMMIQNLNGEHNVNRPAG